MQPKPVSSLTKGVLIALLLIVFNILTIVTSLDKVPGVAFVGHIILIVGLVWSIAYYGKQLNYVSTFGKYFLHGFAITAIVTCLLVVFMAVYMIIDPAMKQQALDKAAEEMRKNPNYTDEQMSQALDISKRFFVPMVLGSLVLGYMFLGTIVSLVTAAIIKKNPPAAYGTDTFENIKPIE